MITGPPESELKGSKLGAHIFEISDLSVGNSFKLTIEIPVPPVMAAAGLTSPPLMLIVQMLEVIRTFQGVVSLQPHLTSPGNRFVGGFHPRLEGHLVNAGAGHIYYVDVDNTFLKVNRIAGAANKRFTNPYVAAKTPIVPGAVTHYGCRLNLYEHTGGVPNVWPVLIPPEVKQDLKTVHALMFFRPATSHELLVSQSSAEVGLTVASGERNGWGRFRWLVLGKLLVQTVWMGKGVEAVIGLPEAGKNSG